ncbi:MAG: tRNA pseudouridine(38-40) synthase TruA [Gammaproteobacteria bacterium]|jgi:tRNA pseudouridine38-40 synthase
MNEIKQQGSSRIALGVEYDGSCFCGWQMQSHGTRTVQHEVEQALSRVADHRVQVVCAGRTDTGVHATGQVVHFDTHASRKLKAWIMGVNAHLPKDVCVHWAKQVNADFNARFSATRRSYRYVIQQRAARPALYSHRVTWVHHQLDTNAMHTAAQALLGENDFSSFRSSACQSEHAMRCVESIDVTAESGFVYIDIRANAFLHHMVRNIVGSLLKVGCGDQPVAWIAELLALKDRNQAGPTAPAEGLYLVDVQYPPEYDLALSGLLPWFGTGAG